MSRTYFPQLEQEQLEPQLPIQKLLAVIEEEAI